LSLSACPDNLGRLLSPGPFALHLRQEGQYRRHPGLQDFVNEFVSDAATGRGGYLQGRGLIPLPPGQHEAQKNAAKALPSMGRPAS